jgi:hypothetical protein
MLLSQIWTVFVFFLRKKFAFFFKSNGMIQILQFGTKNANFLAYFFGRKSFLNHNIGPRTNSPSAGSGDPTEKSGAKDPAAAGKEDKKPAPQQQTPQPQAGEKRGHDNDDEEEARFAMFLLFSVISIFFGRQNLFRLSFFIERNNEPDRGRFFIFMP